jgi:tetraacyldisaccharide 4'-kinase
VTQQAQSVHLLSYPDHHFFTARDLEEIRATIQNAAAGAVLLTTEKDATRLHLHLDVIKSWNVPLFVLPIEVAILLNQQEHFDRLVNNFIEQNVTTNYNEEELD